MKEKYKKLIEDKERARCGQCLQDLYSPFDILFNHLFSACYDCYIGDETSDEELAEMGQRVLSLIEEKK
jgi:hypothetical protein